MSAVAKPIGAYGRAVEAGDGMLHIERDETSTYCGKTIACYPLHWDTTTVVACGSCLIAAGVPLRLAGSAETREGDQPT
jgi:hypothetical protein